MVWAGKLVGMALYIEANQRPPVTADIGEALDITILSPDEDRGLTGNIQNAEVTRFR